MRRNEGAVSHEVPAGIDGRIVVAAVVGAYLGAVALARAVFGFDLWWFLGVWTHDWVFLDAQNLTSAAECWRQGHDVLVENPCDPAGRPLNYPRVWLLLALAGVDQTWTMPFGLVIGGVFLVACWWLFGRLELREAPVVVAAVCAPAVMLGVERGQVDLLVFALLVAAAVVWRSPRSRAWLTSPALVLVAAALKLFPVVALGAYALKRDRRALLSAVAAGLAFIAYAAATLADIQTIRHVLPQSEHYSYGGRILVDALASALAAEQWARLGMARQQLVAAAPLAAVAVLGWLAWTRSRLLQRLTPAADEAESWRRVAFHMGALIYVGTFATANNWDYRLVFLLLCVPQLLEWLRSIQHRRLGQFGVVVVLAQLWLGPYAREHTRLDELGSWLLATVLIVLLLPGARAAWRDLRRKPAGNLRARL